MNDRDARRTKLKKPTAGACIGSILSRAAENYDGAETCGARVYTYMYTSVRSLYMCHSMELLEFRNINCAGWARDIETCTSFELRLTSHARHSTIYSSIAEGAMGCNRVVSRRFHRETLNYYRLRRNEYFNWQ